jgi:type VI secretion system protein ImpM
MSCSLFGKLQAKRDFIAIATPRAFLSVFEPWIQSAISASRSELKEDWQTAFLVAPIWRFWLGAELCGASVAGAIMPSMDGVGRYFPLAIFSVADAHASIPPPELNPQEGWFTALEAFLLSTLEPGRSFDQINADLNAVPAPFASRFEEGPANLQLLEKGAALVVGEAAVAESFRLTRIHDHARAYAALSFWWTEGGEGYDRHALAARHLPDPYLFSGMLTGSFAQTDAGWQR